VIGLVRAEWLKLRSVRSNVILMVAIALLAVGLGALLCAVVPLDDSAGADNDLGAYPILRFQVATAGFGLGLVLLGVLGVQVIGQEYRFNTIRATFSAVPRRGRVLLAKSAVVVGATLTIAAALIALSLLVGGAILSSRGAGLDLSVEGAWRVIIGTWLLAPGYALAGFGIGMILRQPIGAIVAVLAWPMVIEPIVVAFLRTSVGRWMPYNAGSQVVERVGDPDLFSPWGGFAYFCAFALVLCLVGGVMVSRRDA